VSELVNFPTAVWVKIFKYMDLYTAWKNQEALKKPFLDKDFESLKVLELELINHNVDVYAVEQGNVKYAK
jgi:hypothetical protein